MSELDNQLKKGMDDLMWCRRQEYLNAMYEKSEAYAQREIRSQLEKMRVKRIMIRYLRENPWEASKYGFGGWSWEK